MCGIFCGVSAFCNDHKNGKDSIIEQALEEENSVTKKQLNNRGPDFQKFIEYESKIFFWSTVLWQQGNDICQQPLESNKSILLYNGDLFMSNRIHEGESDTNWLHTQLDSCATMDEMIELLTTLKGPYSIIYLNKRNQKLHIIRDSLGRNSLLLGKLNDLIVISSVLSSNNIAREQIMELPCLGIYTFDLKMKSINLELHPWQRISLHEHYSDQLHSMENLLGIDVIVHEAINPPWLMKTSSVADYNFQNIIQSGVPQTDIFKHLLDVKSIVDTCNKTIDCLRRSVEERIKSTPKFCKNCMTAKEKVICTHSRVGILFSGGIDCTIISLLANDIVEQNVSIDLMNVSFEKIARGSIKKDCVIDWNVPDRISAKNTLVELRKLCPNRRWNFIEINIKRAELEDRLRNSIKHLVSPLFSILDESLGAALWFAGSGRGAINNESYESPCRVILTGSGADELFGGYTRHRNAFLRQNQNNDGVNQTLSEELELDWVRLPSRNLARDDRVIADHGVTPRTPFIQEDFVHMVRNLDTLQKCFHGLEQGIGDKLLLRLCAYKLGLRECASLRKRALQFGSRIADRKQNAKDISISLIKNLN